VSFPPKKQIEHQILLALRASRGRARWERVAERVARHFKLDEEATSNQTTKAAIRSHHTDWQQHVRSVGLRMAEISRRGGKWTITELGRDRIKGAE